MGRTLSKHEEVHSELFDLGRSHEQNDQKHFSDTEVHWGRFERDWQTKRFENLEKAMGRVNDRFDTQDKILNQILSLVQGNLNNK